MIDGVKIEVLPIHGISWKTNVLLDFYAKTSISTGEVFEGSVIAVFKGLKFIITQSQTNKDVQYYSVRGSLHKYFNNGLNNANDFTFNNLNTVINELHQKFNINPTTAVIHNIEFGVNIYTPITVKEILKNIVIKGNTLFTRLKLNGVMVGKVNNKQRTDIKVYDKGKQNKIEGINLLRFEVSVKRMQYLKDYNIKTLSDLQNIDNITPLGGLLLDSWQSIIYYDKKVAYKQMTNFEHKKLLYYATPRNWVDFNYMQRMRAKAHFITLMSKYSTSTSRKEITNLIANKWAELSADICIQINHDKKETVSRNMYTNYAFKYSVKTYTSNPLNTSIIKLPKTPLKKERICKVCKSDISHKKPQTKFCTKKCNNTHHGKTRTHRNQLQRNTEKQYLQKLIKILPKNRLCLLVSYKENAVLYTDQLNQNEIHTTTDWISKVTAVTVTGHRKNSKPIVLHSYRARKLIKLINTLNTNVIQ